MAVEDEIFLQKKPVDSTTLENGADSGESGAAPEVSTIGEFQQPDTSFFAKYGKYSLVATLTLVGVGIVAYVMFKNRNK